ncbi:UDP-N-acetylmuramate--L-alanine ligase [hot springs metagenome]|uniref:UDP-N-acetylmuramate--L-alanine ligase n=1 Tax=hot springs metagenome TaxID=433727 RepID=A0A5J4KWR9_9ZZZZ
MKIFFSGIGGSGVSAIASFMADKGHIIFGSDRAFDNNPYHPLCNSLKSKGICIVPQDGHGIDSSFDLSVFSTAVEHDQPDFLKAKSLKIPIKTRPEYLAEIVSDFKTIAVAGTSGKSTTSGMLAFLMQRLGLKPNFIGGGRVKQFRTETNPGNSITGNSDFLIIEACESDGTIVNYKPMHSIILNLDLDHHSIEKTAAMFEIFIKNTADKIIINADDNNLRGQMLEVRNHRSKEKIITFSIDMPSHYKAENIFYKPFNTNFFLKGFKFSLSIPGKYNLYNALSCIAMLSEMGIPLRDIADVLHEFNGIERRFDIHLNNDNHLVIDDYAHNPHKISALMQTVKNLRNSVCYIFQPHGFAPTRMMKTAYIDAFVKNIRDSDHLILLPIFYAGGTVSKDISSHDIADGIRARGKSVEVIDNRNEISKRLNEWDNYIIFGARDETLSDFARKIATSLAFSSTTIRQ